MDRVFFSVSYLMRLPIVVQLLHSVQALPDSSDKLGLVSVTFQTKRRQTGLASAKKNGWQNKLRNRSTCPKLRKTISIPEGQFHRDGSTNQTTNSTISRPSKD